MRPPLSYRLTAKAVFGTSGIDVRTRLVLDEALERRFPDSSMAERKGVFLNILPLQFGDRFPPLAVVLTLTFGGLFIFLAPESMERAVLSMHALGAPAVSYAVLVLQWLFFYLAMSLAGAGVASAVALVWYGTRASRA